MGLHAANLLLFISLEFYFFDFRIYFNTLLGHFLNYMRLHCHEFQ